MILHAAHTPLSLFISLSLSSAFSLVSATQLPHIQVYISHHCSLGLLCTERGGRGAGGRPRQPIAHDCGEVRPLLGLTHLEHAARRELLEQRRAEGKGRRQHAATAARAQAVVGGELVAAAGEEQRRLGDDLARDIVTGIAAADRGEEAPG